MEVPSLSMFSTQAEVVSCAPNVRFLSDLEKEQLLAFDSRCLGGGRELGSNKVIRWRGLRIITVLIRLHGEDPSQCSHEEGCFNDLFNEIIEWHATFLSQSCETRNLEAALHVGQADVASGRYPSNMTAPISLERKGVAITQLLGDRFHLFFPFVGGFKSHIITGNECARVYSERWLGAPRAHHVSCYGDKVSG